MRLLTYKIIKYENFLKESKKKSKKWLDWIKKNNILTKHTFDIIIFSGPTLFKLLEFNFTHMTRIQSTCIPFQLSGFDILGSAQTGSGKTLAFALPMVEFIYTVRWNVKSGTAGIIISPTRELAIQTYHVFRDLLYHHHHSYGIIIGGANRKTEIEKLKKGQEILVATPGRLLDHLKSNFQFKFNNLQQIVVDEADRCLEIGFEEELNEIFKILPIKKQTIMFTATQDKQINLMDTLSFRKKPIFLNIENEPYLSTFKHIIHGFTICHIEDKVSILISFVKKNIEKKMIVFFSSCNEVRFFSFLFKLLGIQVVELHGKQKQTKRVSAFFSFCRLPQSILFSTDLAARGLDIPSVDWIIQYNPPLNPKEYIHRTGRTGRGVNGKGKAILFLLPSEIGFLKYLKKKKIEINEFKFPNLNFIHIQTKIGNLVEKNSYLEKLSKAALKSFIHSYNNYSLKEVFDLKKINKILLYKSFGMSYFKQTIF